MWRNVDKQVCSEALRFANFNSFCRTSSSLGFSQDSVFPQKFNSKHLDFIYCSNIGFPVFHAWKIVEFNISELCSKRNELLGRPSLPFVKSQFNMNGLCSKSYASVAEAIAVSSSDVEEDVSVADEVQELLTEMRREEVKQRAIQMDYGMGRRKYIALKKRQVKIETEAWEQAAKEYKELLNDMCEKKLAPNLPCMKSLFLGWYEPLRNKIAEEQESFRQGKTKVSYGKHLLELPAGMMAVITMHKLVGLLMTGGEHGYARVVEAACLIGDAVEQEVRIHKFLKKTSSRMLAITHEYLEKKKANEDDITGEEQLEELGKTEKLRETVTNLMQKQKLWRVQQILKTQNDAKPWGQDAKAKVGSRVIELLLQTAYIQAPADQFADTPPDVRPAFAHTFRTVMKEKNGASRRYGVIQCDPLVLQGLNSTAGHMVIPYMPMLVPPVKWTGYNKGAHFYLPSHVMRTHGSKQQQDALQRTPPKQLKPVFEALDTLGHTKWRVNKRVLSVIERIWASGGGLAGLVDRIDVPLPEKPDTDDEAVLRKWKWRVTNVKKENSERQSLRCDTDLKLSVARKMKDEEGFFYPHNIDFRGRAYPMHPHLNHLGSDVCRGILEFAEGRPLGNSGLHWLKIHLANLYANGVDKLSHEGRLAFTENHLEDIFDSADKPLEGKRWWLNAEDPFQCLAVCINLAEALRSSSLETTVSHVPVHQDGSCNGLQHYAALGRDELGAAAVNLVAVEKPADVYSEMAARVLNIMKRHAQEDPAKYPYAKILINQVDRKLVKQTVMTSVYGVTYRGARLQIKRRLKERSAIVDDKMLFPAATYTAKTTLAALGEMFDAAGSIMCWLGECAKIIAKENQPVRWTTPLGLPVVQPYHEIGRRLVRTSLQVLSLQQETEKIMASKQKTAFPPNFVHSLDSSHMMMTAVACRKAGLNFAGVHDSYWTHACDVDVMNRILREKFVELYEMPILENLLESFKKSFPSASFPSPPERGRFDLRDVLESSYFFN